MRVLVLGGTTEASELARLLAADGRFDGILSLAGRTTNPKPLPMTTRIGGFGGADGLARWLADERIDAVVDATHPYAANISRNAVAACRQRSLPLASLRRPEWSRTSTDRWVDVATAAEAAAALGAAPRRVFLSLGRLEIAAFASAPHHDYIARSIDPPGDVALPPAIRFLFARGPFDEAAERRLMDAERIEIVVSKNSGGAATYGKIAAARQLGLPVIMIQRPEKPAGEPLSGAADAMLWLERQFTDVHQRSSSRRGV